MQLDVAGAEAAVAERIARPLGLSTTEAARAIVEITNANMGDALRVVSVRRGYDPRDFALVAFGGAGPVHGAALAAELGVNTVIVPPNAGVTSALGCLLVDVRHDLSETYLVPLADADEAAVEARFSALQDEGARRLEAEGITPDRRELTRFLDLRYTGQWRS